MRTNKQTHLQKIILVIVLAIPLISCQPMATPTQSLELGEIQDIRVQTTEPTKTTSKVEQFPLPNCGGSDKLAQSLGTFASVSKSATLGATATVTGGGEVAIPETAKLKLEIQVELAYQQAFESANSRLDTIVMSAAAGTHVVYTIVWEEQTFSSIVQYSSDGKVYEAPYVYKLSVPKLDTSYNVSCEVNSDPGNVSATQTAIVQSKGAVDCLSSDYIPPLTGIHPPTATLICIPSNTIAWISSDPAQLSIPSADYNKTFNVGYTFVLFGPVRFSISGVDSKNLWLDSRTDTSLVGNFDGKTLNLIYQDGKVCDYALYTGSACP